MRRILPSVFRLLLPLDRHLSSFFFLALVTSLNSTAILLIQLLTVTPGTKFDVTYDSEETLKTFQVTELPSHPPVYPFFPKEQL